jgi:hypothetical protein
LPTVMPGGSPHVGAVVPSQPRGVGFGVHAVLVPPVPAMAVPPEPAIAVPPVPPVPPVLPVGAGVSAESSTMHPMAETIPKKVIIISFFPFNEEARNIGTSETGLSGTVQIGLPRVLERYRTREG